MDTTARKEELYGLLGDLPDRHRPVRARKVGEERREGYILEKLVLDLNGIEAVPAFFVRPEALQGRAPAVLYNHAHGGAYDIGKERICTGAQSAPGAALRPGTHSAGILRIVRRYLALRRTQGACGSRVVQAHALARAGAVGNDGLRQPARAGLFWSRARRWTPTLHRSRFPGVPGFWSRARRWTPTVSGPWDSPWVVPWPGGQRPWTRASR